jgi:hypothetical protein
MAACPSAPAFIAANAPLLLRLPPLYNKSAPTSFPIPISPLQSRRSQYLAAPPPLALPMSSSHKNVAAKGFGHGCLMVAEAWELYHAGYLVPPDMCVPSSGGWRMAVNGVGFRRHRRARSAGGTRSGPGGLASAPRSEPIRPRPPPVTTTGGRTTFRHNTTSR